MTKKATATIVWEEGGENYIFTGSGKDQLVFDFYGDMSWQQWLEQQSSFAFQGKNGRISLQKELRPRSKEGYWYAYRRQGKRMVKQYLGRSSNVTLESLESTAQALSSKAADSANTPALPEQSPETGLLAPVYPQKTGIEPADKPQTEIVTYFSDTLLEPKLKLPRLRSSLVMRRRLFERLDEGLGRKLTLVSAPAGSGKTTLVRQWLAERFEVYPLPPGEIPKIAWVSLDPGDNDPVRFWRYILTACQAGGFVAEQASLEQFISPPQALYPPSTLQTELVAFLVAFLNELTKQPGSKILVLEDFHTITSAQLHEALDFFLEKAPPGLHLIIISRYDPPLSLARLRGQGELIDLHFSELRFSSGETGEFLKDNGHTVLPEETILELIKRLEGWAAGLRLLSLALQNFQDNPAVERLLETFTGSHRPIQDYFVSEVLSMLPAQLQNFILRTSILERLTPALCQAVTGNDNSTFLLQNLEKANLFLEPLGASGDWYRYHALFAEAMQQILRNSYTEQDIKELYLKASRWFEQKGMLKDAVEAALKAREYEQVARLIEQNISKDQYLTGTMLFQEVNEFFTLDRWLNELPVEIIRRYPVLCLCFSLTKSAIAMVRQIDMTAEIQSQIMESLNWAEEGSRATNNRENLAMAVAIRSMLAHRKGDFDQAREQAEYALTLLPKSEQVWRKMVSTVLGQYELYNGQIDRSKRYLNDALQFSGSDGNRNFVRATIGLLAWTYADQGELHQSSEYINMVLAEAREINDNDDICHSQLGLAGLSLEWNDLDAVEKQIGEVINLTSPGPNSDTWIQAAILHARLLHARGQTTQALEQLDNLLNVIRLPETVIYYQLYREARLVQARIYLDTGEEAGFARWLGSISPSNQTLAGKEFKVYRIQWAQEQMLLARWLIAQGEWHKALVLLEPLLDNMRADSRLRNALKIRLYIALALAAGNKLDLARQMTRDVLSQAHLEGFIRIFLDEGEPVATLLRTTSLPPGSKSINQYRDKILLAFDHVKPHTRLHTGSGQLTPQEQRVMDMLETDLSYEEIARQLVVSVNTIKSQVKSIYQKLGVKNRQQARIAARQLSAE